MNRDSPATDKAVRVAIGRMNAAGSVIVAAIAVAAVLGGCGVRGALEKPSASADGAPAVSPTADASSGQGRPADAPPKPHQSFILDPLITSNGQ